MDIRINALPLIEGDADTILVCLPEGDNSFDDVTNTVNTALNGAIGDLIEGGDFKGEQGQIAVLYPRGAINARRVIIVGSGKPEDLNIEQCRQCVDPECVAACTQDALSLDARFGNVRSVVDLEKCVGCGACVEACPFAPSRSMMVSDEKYGGDLKARKCDLCAQATYHWDPAGGGPPGSPLPPSSTPVLSINS